MRNIFKLTLIIIATILFEYNFELTYYFIPDISTGELYNDWWELRKVFYSIIFMILTLTIFLSTKGLTKIMTLPLLGFTIDDVIDRTVFNSPTWHWTDYILITTTTFVMVMLIYNYVRPPRRIDKGFY